MGVKEGFRTFFKGMNNRKITVLVEGNIGSGKTTFLQYCKKDDLVQIYEEPVEKWRNVGGNNLLDLMYKNPKEHAAKFQHSVLLSMFQIHSAEIPKNKRVKLMERSLFTSYYCFIRSLHESKLIQDPDCALLTERFEEFKKRVASADYIVYLQAEPEVLLERIKMRGRPEEQKITLDYLRKLNKCHDDLLLCGKYPDAFSRDKIAIKVFDANKDRQALSEFADQFLAELRGGPLGFSPKRDAKSPEKQRKTAKENRARTLPFADDTSVPADMLA